jgi:Flp pilus assembly protein TadB
MDLIQLLFILGSIVGIVGFGALAYALLGGSGGRTNEIRELMATSSSGASRAADLNLEEIKKRSRKKKKKKGAEDLSTKLFNAGYFSAADRRKFLRFRIISFAICLLVFPIGMYAMTARILFAVLCLFLGALIGFTIPMSWLERQIRTREEDVMYFLPLVIEQVSIGVSSALDVGPCISNIVEMAEERDSHNAVTELFTHVEKLIRSGLSLEDALMEVGEANGTTEVKHAFMFLAQCSRHGGEVSKQLQELADSVMVQRQVQVEGKITSLPVKATGPLAMVFAGFFALLFAGLLVRLLSAFGG